MHSRGKGLIITYICTGLNIAISLFLSIFILRMLGQTEYGIYQTATAFISYLTILEFGIGTVITRNISLCKKDGSDNDEIQKNVSTIWRITQILALVILICFVGFYFSMDFIYSNSMTYDQVQHAKTLFMIMSANLILSFFSQVFTGCATGYEYYGLPSIVSIVQIALRTLLLVVFLFLYSNAIVIVLVDMFVQLVTIVFYCIFCKKKLHFKLTGKYFDKKIFKYSAPLALAMFIQVIINTANGNVDKTVISIMMNPESVSVYAVCMYIYTMFSSLAGKPISLYMPQVAKNMRAGLEGRELTKTLINPCRVIILIGGNILFGFIAVGRPFICSFYGNDYTEAWLMAVIVMAPMFISLTNNIMLNVLDVLNKRHIRSIALAGVTASNILLTIVGIKYLGMIGAAIATAICTFIGEFIVMNMYYSRKLNISVSLLYKEGYKGTLLSLIISCAAGYLVSMLISNSLVSFLVGGVVFVIVEVVCLLTFGLNKSEKQIVFSKISKFTKKGDN